MLNKLLRIISLLLIIISLNSCNSDDSIVDNNFDGITGSGNIIENQYGFKDFSKVQLSHSFKSKIIKGNEFKIILRIDDNLNEYVQVSYSDQLLSIQLDPDYNYQNVHLEAEITMPDLEFIELSGACSAEITGFNFTHNFSAIISGASNIASTITCGNADINLSGASNAAILGSGKDLTLIVSGASNVEMSSFEADNAKVIVSGASRSVVFTNGQLDANVSGASSLFYKGNPIMGNIVTSGASTIQKL